MKNEDKAEVEGTEIVSGEGNKDDQAKGSEGRVCEVNKDIENPLRVWDEIAEEEEAAIQAWYASLHLISWSQGNDDQVAVDPQDPSLVGQTVRLYDCWDQCSGSDSVLWETAVETMLDAIPYLQTVYATFRGRIYEATPRSPLYEAMMNVLRGRIYNDCEDEEELEIYQDELDAYYKIRESVASKDRVKASQEHHNE